MKSKFTELSLAEQDKSETVKFSVNKEKGVTVCRLFDRWYGRTFIGVSRCHDVDVFDEKKGRAIAFNKARKKELVSDLRLLDKQRERLTRWFEEKMNAIDKNEGLKRIYLAGVNDELNELMGVEPVYSEEVGEPAAVLEIEKVEDKVQYPKPEDIKLTQFATFIEQTE